MFGMLLLIVAVIYAPDIRDFAQKLVQGGVKDANLESAQATDIELPPSDEADTIEGTDKESKFVQTYKGVLSVNEVIDATNKERTKAGLTPLATNTRLILSAKKKVDDMIALQYFEHTSPTGKTVSDLADAQSYSYIILGENLAVGDFLKTSELLDAWMKSPGHKANIVNPQYQEIGAYAAQATYQGRRVWFAVQHFGTSQAVCPKIDTNLKRNIDKANKDLKDREVAIEKERIALEGTDALTLSDYKSRVNTFNSLVAQYNTLLGQVKAQIVAYNEEVRVFNRCIGVFQKNSPNKEIPAAANP